MVHSHQKLPIPIHTNHSAEFVPSPVSFTMNNNFRAGAEPRETRHPLHRTASAEETISTIDFLRRTQSVAENYHTFNVLKKPYERIESKYHLGREIGRGQYGVIRLCVDTRTAVIYACKVIGKSTLTSQQQVEDVQLEVRIMEALRGHPAIIDIVDTVEDEKAIYLVMELCGGGELFDRITERKRYTEPEAAEVCYTLLSVLNHLRSKGIVHRDLKPENILLCNSRSDTKIKVIDFGLARFVRNGSRLQSMSGSAYYIAPEVLNGDYGIEVDMWSVGIILYVLLRGIPPFWAEDEEDIFKAIRTGKFDTSHGPWKNISNEAKDLVKKMLTMEPCLRVTPKQALAHPWFRMNLPSECDDVDAAVPVAEAILGDVEEIAMAIPVDDSYQEPDAKVAYFSHRRTASDMERLKVRSTDEIYYSSAKRDNKIPHKSKDSDTHSREFYHHELRRGGSGIGIDTQVLLSRGEGSGDYSFSPLGSNSRLDSGDLAFLSESILSFRLR